MTDFPDMKLKAVVLFPASVAGGTGIDVEQSGGQYTFNLDFSEIAPIGAIPALAVPTTYALLWQSTQDTYRIISVTDLQATIGAGIPDAPVDGTIYGRRNAAWVAAPSGGGGGGSSVTISDTAPAGAVAGNLWWKSSNGLLYIFYNDGTSSQWVIAAPVSDPSTFILKGGDTVTGVIAFTQSPTAPTPTLGDNSAKVATTAFVVAAQAPTGAVVNSVYAEYTSQVALTALMPVSTTLPTNTQGTQILTVTITPKKTTNLLRVRFRGYAAPVSNDNMAAAIFLNSETNARAADYTGTPAGFSQPLVLECQFVPGATTPQTVSVRAGCSVGNMTFNANMGGARRATLVVEEIGA